MSTQGKFSFLDHFDFGNRDVSTPGVNILSVTSQAAGDFDKANLTTESLRHVWRSASVVDWQDIIIKAELISRVDTIAILGHNFSQDAVIKIQANIANNWVAPDVDITVPWSENNIILCQDLGDQYEYYRIRILDPGNICGYIEIGRIVGGRAYTMAEEEDITDDVSWDWEDKSDVMKTEGYFRAGNDNVKPITARIAFSKLRTVAGQNDNYLALKALCKHVGTTKPFLAIADRDDPTFLSLWGQLDKLPSFTTGINRYVSFGLNISEMF